MSSDTILHELCKGFNAINTRSKHNPNRFIEQASQLNDRGSLPLHTACSHKAPAEIIETLLKACPSAASQPNANGNLPLHQAAMWQASVETVQILLSRHPDAAIVRNQYGSLPLHIAASNHAPTEVVQLLIQTYPDALHLQNDDGMTPLDLALGDESASEAVLALLQNKALPPDLNIRQQTDEMAGKAKTLERKLHSLRHSSSRQSQDMVDALSVVRRLADRFPHALYCAGVDPNELEIALSEYMERDGMDPDGIILEAVQNRNEHLGVDESRIHGANGNGVDGGMGQPEDRVEDLLGTIVGLDHIKSQVRGLRRTTEICDLRESHFHRRSKIDPASYAYYLFSDITENRPRTSHMIFVGNPGTGKTAIGRLLAKTFHELGILRKPKFLEVERMDLVGKDRPSTISKTRDVLEEAKGGILFIDEAFTLGIVKKQRNSGSSSKNSAYQKDCTMDAIQELMNGIDEDRDAFLDTSNFQENEFSDFPLIILAGFPMEMQRFLSSYGELRKRFPITFEFPDYTCMELATIFRDLANAKGFDLEDDLTIEVVANMLEQETSPTWRNERNGRVCELLLAGARTEVRNRRRAANFEGEEEVDPHLIVLEDVENVIRLEFK